MFKHRLAILNVSLTLKPSLKMKKLSILIAGLLIASSAAFAQKTWNIDPSHTDINFAVEHMVISEVEGSFHDFEAKVVTKGESLEGAEISFTAQVASIDTDNEQRDGHLKSADFFDAETYPTLTFKSTGIEKTGEGTYKLTGDLTIHGTTKQVVLDVKHKGTINDPYGNERAGFKLTGTINRFDFGLKWNAALEAGGLVVGEEVDINCNIEVIAAKNDR